LDKDKIRCEFQERMASPGMLGFQERGDFRWIELLQEIFPQMFQGTLHVRLKHFDTVGNQDFGNAPTDGPLFVNQQ